MTERTSLDTLGELQRTVLEIVWERGEATVHDVRERLGRRKRLAYTTVLTVMQKLEKAGWLRHRSEGKSYVYRPTRSRAEAGARSLQRVVKGLFDGDALLMFQHLIRDGDLSDEELSEVRKMIDEERKERQR